VHFSQSNRFARACRTPLESSHREQRVGASCSGERLSRDVRAILKRRSPRQQRRGATVCQCHCSATRSCRISFESSRREQSDGGSGERLARDVKSRDRQLARHRDPTVTCDQQYTCDCDHAECGAVCKATALLKKTLPILR
jgi:hypothetical protein